MAYLLADLGGTNLKMCLCGDAGERIGEIRSVPTGALRERETLVSAWADEVVRLTAAHPVRALLMGIPTKERDGRLIPCGNLPTLDGAPLGKMLESRLKMPVFLYPDAACYALGAYARFGAGAENVLAVTLGTGVGAAWILGGRLYRGGGMTGEMWLAPYMGGNLEDTLSTRGLLSRCPAASAAELARRALAGEESAANAFDAYGQALGTLLSYAVGMMDPDSVLIGGGIARGRACFEEAMLRVLRAHTVRGGAHIVFCGDDDGWSALAGAYLMSR